MRKRKLSGPATEASAPAKVNLALHLRGRRPDGYHLIESLVVFTDFGDTVSAVCAPDLTFCASGPFAGEVPASGSNLVMRAARMMAEGQGAALSLRKSIPVAAGLGGGSSDAAAAMRLLSRRWGVPLPGRRRSLELGADLPVCLGAKPARVEGIGERLSDLPPLPEFSLVLVNPGRKLSTADVYAAADSYDAPALPPVPRFASARELADWLRCQRNELEIPAVRLCPSVADVLAALRRSRECLMARMSGSGPTCFGMFRRPESAEDAAGEIRRGNPRWWVQETAV